jgi:hypothetical protein
LYKVAMHIGCICSPFLLVLPVALHARQPVDDITGPKFPESVIAKPLSNSNRKKGSLLQAGAKWGISEYEGVVAPHTRWANSRLDPAYFGDFSQDESTYTFDGTLAGRGSNPEINVLDGWNPQFEVPILPAATRAEFFHESPSGAYKEAWQSHFPALTSTVAGNDVKLGKWFTGTGGVWQQDYLSGDISKPGGPPPSWFDASVKQIDGFGRRKFPGLGSPRRELLWEEKSSNTTLSCKKAGCTANVSLLAPFDWKTETANQCKLSVYFHPTDFDDTHKAEKVEWVQVNGVNVSTSCRPHALACNTSAHRELLPCVLDLPMENLMTENGAFSVAAKISDAVDECPYNGNYLSAVPMVTCLVAKQGTQLPDVGADDMKLDARAANCSSGHMPFACTDMNCSAQVQVPLCFSSDLKSRKCKLRVSVQQTDFDGQDGTEELIEYIKVDGKSVKENIKPGKNPCKAEFEGKPLDSADLHFTALEDFALELKNTSDVVLVQGKISPFVDECESDGNLLKGWAQVFCEIDKADQNLQAIQEEAARTHKQHVTLRGRTSEEQRRS